MTHTAGCHLQGFNPLPQDHQTRPPPSAQGSLKRNGMVIMANFRLNGLTRGFGFGSGQGGYEKMIEAYVGYLGLKLDYHR